VVEPGEIRSVIDGDTVRLTDNRRVRLLQIDAPEEGECYARPASAALGRLTPRGQKVVLEPDPSLDDHDEHGRSLRYLRIGGLDAEPGTTVNFVLVRQGAAVPYFFRGQRGIYADELLTAAREARRNRRGLWGACPGAKLDRNRGSLTGPA
jgi:micrococcal nuclease